MMLPPIGADRERAGAGAILWCLVLVRPKGEVVDERGAGTAVIGDALASYLAVPQAVWKAEGNAR